MILSVTIMFVKSQYDNTTWMEITAILDTGELKEMRLPMNGRTIRIDAETLLDPVLTVENGEDVD